VVHRRLRCVVERLRLGLVDDEAGHRADVDDRTLALVQHLLAEGAAAPEPAVEVDLDAEAPVIVAGVLGAHVALGDASVVDQDVTAAAVAHDPRRHVVDLAAATL
jgi:hypothetical protein